MWEIKVDDFTFTILIISLNVINVKMMPVLQAGIIIII